MKGLKAYFGFLALILVFMLLLSVLELTLYATSHALPLDFITLLTSSWAIDVLFWISWIFLPCLFFLPIYVWKPKVAKILFSVFIFFFFAIHLLLISYFNISLVLLGSDLFGYSLLDIEQTVGASGSLSMGSILLFLMVLVPLLAALQFISDKIPAPKYIALALPLFSVLIFLTGIGKKIYRPDFGSDFANTIVINKSEHFYREAEAYFFDTGFQVDIYSDSYLGGFDHNPAAALKPLQYMDDTYPFLHPKEEGDVLSPFLKPKEKAPDLVFIIVEGLGRAFANEGALLGNFTPFLDSLSKKSLYWKNFLSTGGRTFAILPSLFGSLPFAENGFLELKDEMPKEASMLSILRNYGYEISFHYGGDAQFDAMKGYLLKNGTNTVHDEGTFPDSYKKMPSNNNFSWGYGDRELYSHYLNIHKTDTLSSPKLTILLTVATHNPFLINEEKTYLRRLEKHLDGLNISQEKKKGYANYKKQYATVLYADDALKSFLAVYKKRPDFENTIFFITGDHRIPEIPLSTKIDRYHVPLIIYTPLLDRTAEIASISSHFDVAPSLLNYLANNHDVKVPDAVSFMGRGLDTVRSFRNMNQIPLMQTKTDLVDFIMEDYHLNRNDLFQLDENMGENLVDDPQKKQAVRAAFQEFKRRNQKLIEGAKLVPDSIYKKYGLQN
ncbi:MAG: LTA synthase family protein [Sediminicola sp.]